MKQIQRIYLSGPVSRGVAQSQMINWALVLEEYLINTKFLVFYHAGNVEKLNSMVQGSQFSDINIKKYINVLFIRELILFITILKRILSLRNKSGKVILQTRSTAMGLPLLIIKLLLKIKVVYEIRGAGEEGNNPRVSTDLLNRLNEYILLRTSDLIISVSEKLLKYKVDKFQIKHLKKAIVIYGAADINLFNFDENLRNAKINEFNLRNKTTLLYIGMLDKEWQVPDKLFRLVAELKKNIPDIYFILVTPNLEIARKYCEKHKISVHESLIVESEQEKLREYINAADFGILLRENKLVNNVASPTKFAEYIVCGLPVIISEGIGDYSEMVVKEKLGVVVNIDNTDYDLLTNEIINKTKFMREIIAKKGRQYLVKQIYIDILVNSYATI